MSARRPRRPRSPRPAAGPMLAALLLVAGGCGREAPPRDTVLLTLDTTRWDHLGAYGDPGARTPVLDAIARRGVTFERAFVDVPSTLPSHTTMMTGAESLRHGVRMNGEFSLPDAARTLAERFRDGGFATGGVVASVTLKAVHGLAQGFDAWDDTFREPFTGIDPDLELRSRRHEGTQRRADEVTTVALEVAEGLDRPVFLWAHYVDPHLTYDPPPPWDRVPGLAPYDGEIAFMDREIGRLLRGLREAGLDPVVAAIADHGEGLGEHGQDGHGMFLYETTVRVPFLLAGAGPSRIVGEPVRNADLAPTLERAAGLPPTVWPDGVDVLDRRGGARRDGPVRLLHETLTPTRRYGGTPLKAVRTLDAKYVHAPRPELYDLAADPRELDNLFAGDVGEAAELRDWLEEEVDRLKGSGEGNGGRVALDDAQVEAIRSLGYLVEDDDRLPADELSVDGIDPKDIIDVVLAHRYVFDRRWDEARPRLDRFFARWPEFPGPGWEKLWARAQFALALVEASEGDHSHVRERVETALRLDPGYSEARATLAELDAGRGR